VGELDHNMDQANDVGDSHVEGNCWNYRVSG